MTLSPDDLIISTTPKTFSLIGASTKRNDKTKIGWFGSGLKYSIAYLLRNELEFKFFAGADEVIFDTIEKEFREESFKVISVNGKETSLTTEMGGDDWTHWSIIREIYCNAIDEAGESIELVDEVIPEFDQTTFFLRIDENSQDVVDNWDDYFSLHRKNLIHEKDNSRLFPGGGNYIVYRKGIRALFVKNKPSLFHYDMDWAQINESRVLKDQWSFEYKLVEELMKLTNLEIISKILRKVNDCHEKDFYWDTNYSSYSRTWLDAIKDRVLVKSDIAGYFSEEIAKNKGRYLILPSVMVDGLKNKFEDEITVIDEDLGGEYSAKFTLIKPSPKQEFLLGEVEKFFDEVGYKISYPVNICVFEKDNTLGLAWKDQIYVSEKVFNQGRRQIAEVIVEEQEHLKTGFNDETRAFQTHFIELFVSALEEKKGVFL